MLRDKLMEALRCKTETRIDRPDCGGCPYNNTLICNTQQMFADMLTLMEPVKPYWNQGRAYCGACGERLPMKHMQGGKYCSYCGQAVKWGTVLTGDVEEVNPELAKKGNENDPL